MAHGLSCSAAMWDLPGLGIKPVSPALAGGFPTTAPPGKPASLVLDLGVLDFYLHRVQCALSKRPKVVSSTCKSEG